MGRFVAQLMLDGAQTDAEFQQVSAVTVAQGMDRDGFVKAAALGNGAEGFLRAEARQGFAGSVSLGHGFAGGKDQCGMTMGAPIAAQGIQGRLWQGHEAVFTPLALAHMDFHALGIDVADT